MKVSRVEHFGCTELTAGLRHFRLVIVGNSKTLLSGTFSYAFKYIDSRLICRLIFGGATSLRAGNHSNGIVWTVPFIIFIVSHELQYSAHVNTLAPNMIISYLI